MGPRNIPKMRDMQRWNEHHLAFLFPKPLNYNRIDSSLNMLYAINLIFGRFFAKKSLPVRKKCN